MNITKARQIVATVAQDDKDMLRAHLNLIEQKDAIDAPSHFGNKPEYLCGLSYHIGGISLILAKYKKAQGAAPSYTRNHPRQFRSKPS